MTQAELSILVLKKSARKGLIDRRPASGMMSFSVVTAASVLQSVKVKFFRKELNWTPNAATTRSAAGYL
jgi:hypothetical protein